MNRRLKKFVVPAVFAAAFVWWSCDDGQDTTPLAPQIEAVTPHYSVLPSGGGSGAIFTTTPDGGIVNENVHYEGRNEVYLDGGPKQNAPAKAAGLDEGFYVFQITDPPGKMLLSRDPARCRIVHVSAAGVIDQLMAPTNNTLTDPDGNTVYDYTQAATDNWQDPVEKGKSLSYENEPCHVQEEPDGAAGTFAPTPDITGVGRHDTNTDLDHGLDEDAIVVQMMPYGLTPNPGGVYKAWMTPIQAYNDVKVADLNAVPSQLPKGKQKPHECGGFCAEADPGFVPSHRYTKTDNFKVTEKFPAEIRVRKFHDINYNGVWDEGEPEIGKDLDQCVLGDGTLEDPCDVGGGWPYIFTWPVDGGTADDEFFTAYTHVAAFAGTYSAEEDYFPGKWVQSASWLDGSYQNPFQKKVEVYVQASSPGETHEIWFGNTMPGKITGKKVIDFNANGVIDAGDVCPATDPYNNTTGCAGVKVLLTGTDGMGMPVADDVLTNAAGEFEFSGLMPGTYKVEIDEPNGFFCSYPKEDDCSYDKIVITSGLAVDLNKDQTGAAAFADWKPAKKKGMKFEDLDGDGAPREDGEPGLKDWRIRLWNGLEGDLKVDEVRTTDENGEYTFDGLRPGSYKVCEVLKDGVVDYSEDWVQTFPKKGDGLDCSQFDGEGVQYGHTGYQITLKSGEVDADNDFGNFMKGWIKVCKVKDADGKLDTTGDQSPKAGWPVYLTIDGKQVRPTQYTELKGEEACTVFDDLGPLPADSYYDVHEEKVDGWIPISPIPPAFEFGDWTSGQTETAYFINTPTQGCTPGFWGGGTDGGQAGGQWLWNQGPIPTDPEWIASGGDDPPGNPFIWGTLFNDYFAPVSALDGLTMHDLVNTGGGSIDAQKAARSLVAAYLNASWGIAYAYSTAELTAKWNAAVASGEFLALHMDLDKANNAPGGCPISASGY